jgi:hypothetical protein
VLSGPATLEEQLSVLKQIKEAVVLNLSELRLAHSGRPLGTVAWLARNLLELAIWSEHCAASKENAKEFLLDSARDAADSLDIPDGPWLHKSLGPTRKRLLDNASADGFDIEQEYARVSSVAKKLGRGDVFKYLNKMFSKYAHPTALAIFSAGGSAQELLRQKFHELGINLADSALHFLDESGRRVWAEIESDKARGRMARIED